MCRNIHTLFNYDPPVTEQEIEAAARQHVRKITGFGKPSAANAEAFERGVRQISRDTAALLASLVTTAPPKNREEEQARAHERALARFAAR